LKEKVIRLAPTHNTLRQLYTLSGNQCAFPGCQDMMFNMNGNFVGQICHIEAASEGGERFNPNMTNEQRRSYENLVLMCYPHHIETNKVEQYPTHVMKQIKYKHEKAYMNWENRVIEDMYNSFSDVTQNITYNGVNTLKNVFTIEGIGTWTEDDIQECTDIFNKELEIFKSMSPDAITLFKIAFSRATTNKNILKFPIGDMLLFVCPDELLRVINKDRYSFNSIVEELIRNEFITYNEDENMFFLRNNDIEINFWYFIKLYEKQIGADFNYMFSSLDFSCLG
jgi:hypothetical protein